MNRILIKIFTIMVILLVNVGCGEELRKFRKLEYQIIYSEDTDFLFYSLYILYLNSSYPLISEKYPAKDPKYIKSVNKVFYTSAKKDTNKDKKINFMDDNNIYAHNFWTHEEEKITDFEHSYILGFDVSIDGSKMILAMNNNLYLYYMDSQDLIELIPDIRVESVSLNESGTKFLASVVKEWDEIYALFEYDLETKNYVYLFDDSVDYFLVPQYRNDNEFFFIKGNVDEEYHLYLYDLETNTEKLFMENVKNFRINFYYDNNMLILRKRQSTFTSKKYSLYYYFFSENEFIEVLLLDNFAYFDF